MNTDGCIGFAIYRYSNHNVYGIRGSGEIYQNFYGLFNARYAHHLYVNVWDDWPWSYIAFPELNQEKSFEHWITTDYAPNIVVESEEIGDDYTQDWSAHPKLP